MPTEQWEAQNQKKLEDGLYRGTLRRGTHHVGCGCGYYPKPVAVGVLEGAGEPGVEYLQVSGAPIPVLL
jgi:hypothetical protein